MDAEHREIVNAHLLTDEKIANRQGGPIIPALPDKFVSLRDAFSARKKIIEQTATLAWPPHSRQ